MQLFTRAGAALAVAAALVAAPAAAIEIEEVTSPGGTTFWLVQEQAVPLVAVEISFAGGARLDPADRPGLANMMAALLEEGAGDLDATAFAKAADELAARFGFGAGRDNVTVSARMLADDLDRSAALLALALAEPQFDANAVERVRAQILSKLASDETDPNAVAGRLWFARAFDGHPYARDTDGTPESVKAITRDELAAAQKRLMTRGAATVAVVGAIDAARAGVLIDTILAGLDEGDPPDAARAPETPPAGVEIAELDVPQSVAIFGQKGLPRDHPDFIPAYVMNHILGGGGFSSRLMEEVREKRGLAYGVYSYLANYEDADLILGSVQTANDRIAESLEVIRAEWRRMAEEGATAEDLDAAKRYLTGAFALRFDSNAKIARFLVGAQEEDLGLDYINIRNDLIEAVTLDDIRRVAKILDPDGLSIVVVGKPAGL
ncbi:insulinase family protein [Limibaculum sp. M0105]|uniref:Insulinase family protein n=2 Tax=Thermohalobaculum xanthum TaxID=2753746 RepID=A0A8J7SJE7_9RHOB|nr:insulinase family protein [Thermohalobaculum xanthum]